MRGIPSAPIPDAPTVEHHREPLGIGERRPRLSWTVSAPPDWRQRGYQVELSRAAGTTITTADSRDQVLVAWPGEPLRSRERVTARVRVAGRAGEFGGWSPPVTLETGLLDPADWQAQPVGGNWPEDPGSDDRRPALVRREFELDGEPVSARLYASAHGLYEAEINGRRVGDDAMSPRMDRLPAAAALLHLRRHVATCGPARTRSAPGSATAGTEVGWAAAAASATSYGDRPGAHRPARGALRRRARAAHRHRRPVAGGAGPDPRHRPLRRRASTTPGTSSRAGRGRASTTTAGSGRRPPTATPAPWSRRPARRSAAPRRSAARSRCWPRRAAARSSTSARTSSAGCGSGSAATAGRTITLRHAEVLEDGELCTRPLRDRQGDRQLHAGRGAGAEDWEPRFTFHGFRYAEIDGLARRPGRSRATSRRVRLPLRHGPHRLVRVLRPAVTGSTRTSSGACGATSVDIPTDCPQRDERLGWTGDIQVFAPTASFLYDVRRLPRVMAGRPRRRAACRTAPCPGTSR